MSDIVLTVTELLDGVAVEGSGVEITVSDGGFSQTSGDARYVRTVNGTGPDEDGNVDVAGGGGTVESVNGVAPVAGDITLDADDFADGTTNHVFTALDDTKLAGIATAATANDTDANLKARANHTGSQAISTVTGLQTALDGKETAGAAAAAQAASQPLDADLTTIAALDSTTAGALVTDGSGWIRKTYAQLKTALSLVKADVGLGSVDNTADTAKPVSTAQQTALDLKANLASPTFTGTPAAPTASPGDNDTSIATTAFVTAAVAAASSGDGVDLTGPDDYGFTATAAIDTLPSGWSFDRPAPAGTTIRYREGNGRGFLSQNGTFTLFQGIYRSLPAGFSTALFKVSGWCGVGNSGFGPFLRASASGKAAHMTLRATGAMQLTFYVQTGSVGSDYTGTVWTSGPLTDWYFKIVKNSATSWDWYNGPSPLMMDASFSAIDVPGSTNGFTPDQIGFGFLTAGGGFTAAAIDYVKFT